MVHGLRKRAVPCAVPRAPRTGQAFLEKALRTIDQCQWPSMPMQCQWPKDRPTTIKKTDNARADAFALNESRPGAMTKPWRRSWEKGPPSRNGGIVLVAVFHVKAMNRVGDAFRTRKAAQRPPKPAAGRKRQRLGGSFSREPDSWRRPQKAWTVRRHDRVRTLPL